MGLAEISKNNPLKVLHSLLESNNNSEIAFVGISNWRLDASKMNRGVYIARSDLSLDDLENTAQVIFESYKEGESNYFYEIEKKVFKCLAKAYFEYKKKLESTDFPEFHGARDFYNLIKQISEQLIKNSYISIEEMLPVLEIGIERNFQGMKQNIFSIKQEFVNAIFHYEGFMNNKIDFAKHKNSTLDLVVKNLEDKNSRFLMLITRSNSAAYILDTYLTKFIKDRTTLVGSKFEEDVNKEEYSFRTLSEIIMFMGSGWTIVMQDMEHIYGSLYDLFNQNYTIIGGNKRNCRIALGSVNNPMCLVNENFHCIIIINEEQLVNCEPPFLNRFEKYFLSFDSILSMDQKSLITNLTKWFNSITVINDDLERNHKVKIENVVANFSEETISSLILLDSSDYQKDTLDVETSLDIFKKAQTSLIKTFSNFSLLIASQAKIKYENEENFHAFFKNFELVFENSKNLNTFLKNKLTIDSALAFKCVVYTFDNIAQGLNLDIDPKTFKEIKIGIHKSEKSLNQAINNYFKSDLENLLIIRLEWSQHAQHLQLTKFLIEKLKLDYQKNETKQVKTNKSFCIIIHQEYSASKQLFKSLNKYKMSFLSEWEQIMIDSLEDKGLDLLGLIFENSNDLIRNENVVKFNDVFYDLATSALNKMNYKSNKKFIKEFDEKIHTYKQLLLQKFFDTSENDFLVELFKTNIWSSQKIQGNFFKYNLDSFY
jgi:E3 ubiquitin-protein ligase RNF213